MANKMTQVQYFEEIVALAEANGRDDLIEFAEGRITAIKEKSANRKPTANQQENVGLKEAIKGVLDTEKGMTVSEIMNADEVKKFDKPEKPITNQRITAQLTQLVKAEEVVRTVEKKKAYYTLAG